MHRTFPGGLSYPKFLRTPWRLKCMLWGISYPEMLQSTPMYQISHVQQSPGPLSTRSETVSQELSLGNHLFRSGRRSDCLDPPNDDRHTDMMMYVPSCPSMWVHDRWDEMLCVMFPTAYKPWVKAVGKSNWKVHQKIFNAAQRSLTANHKSFKYHVHCAP